MIMQYFIHNNVSKIEEISPSINKRFWEQKTTYEENKKV